MKDQKTGHIVWRKKISALTPKHHTLLSLRGKCPSVLLHTQSDVDTLTYCTWSPASESCTVTLAISANTLLGTVISSAQQINPVL